MKNILLVLFISFAGLSFAQTIQQIDSVTFEMCDFLKTLKMEDDTVQYSTLNEEKLYPFLSTVAPQDIATVLNQVYFRLQRNCPEYRILLDAINPPEDSPVRMSVKPKSEISKNDLKEFKSYKELFYKELSGETVKVVLDESSWEDQFSDGTYSKLSLNWISDKEFELTFIESDNIIRGNFSVQGDKYTYQVISKKEDYFLVSVNIPGQDAYELSKLYYK